MDPQDERTPLLHESRDQSPGLDAPETQQPRIVENDDATPPQISHTARKALPIIILAVVIIFVFDFANMLIQTPMIRIYEEIICRKYFDSQKSSLYPAGTEIPEDECKIAPVQRELALIMGMEPVFDAIPSILVTIPLGMIADNPKVGRKPVITFSIAGTILQVIWIIIVTWFSDIFPLRAVWFGSICLIGGGSSLINAILYTMIIDITEPVERASTFFTMQLAGAWLPMLIGPPITTSMMIKSGSWLPIFIGLAFTLIGFVIVCFFPETMNFKNPDKDSLLDRHASAAASSSSAADTDIDLPIRQKLWSQFKAKFTEFVESSSFVFHSPHLIILVCSLMMHMICLIRAMETLIYYASNRYKITIAEANLLNTINAAVSIGILFLLPFVSTFLTSKVGMTSQRKDLLIARVSVVLFAAGWYIVGIAPTLPLAVSGLVIYTLGSGFSGSVRSLAASYVEAHHQARLSSFIAIMMIVGNFVGSPLLAGLYSFGVTTGNPFWYGLPFFGLTVIFAGIGMALWLKIRLPEEGGEVIQDEDEDEERTA
ncbi:hypothetical protein ABW19_dt0207956 [Dactylella cylindrospora]|nr:hypothetical protein ABW19_dt0207956 [Dactylella cylindrospora]